MSLLPWGLRQIVWEIYRVAQHGILLNDPKKLSSLASMHKYDTIEKAQIYVYS